MRLALAAAGLLARPLWGRVESRAGDAPVVLRAFGLVMAACGLLLGVFGAQWPMVLSSGFVVMAAVAMTGVLLLPGDEGR